MSKLGLSRPTGTVTLCVNLDLSSEHERLSRDLQEAERQHPSSSQGTSPVHLASQIRDLEEQMREHTLTFELQALPKKRFAEIEAAHPPRENHETDTKLGLDMSTGPDAILAADGTIVSVTDPSGTVLDFSGDDWKDEADAMSNGQWETFAIRVLQLNRGSATVPFSRAASRQTRLSEQSSK